ncbi:hypothetical protein [Entomospira culicis]|uniref:Uncharacterized protein n=1 Tax=Entomospira culicis TaxID=2719989 RepID=A0A968GE61_9SPIO|nr:hypothetical protein [Entomospira culicis]NIZ18406.1 hypothetical protein [Entomospira culicis]NIZ68622.1 hypothetical protein [Entomospira culicis]WDI37222.1 hypothetical protein PVA46_00080 [Entomospira culicis]WDI38850.1 hypothetical protein PVA47_00090 [Entomospira culicis]
MRDYRAIIVLFWGLFTLTPSVNATINTRIVYTEQWYRLYHQHLLRSPSDEFENLVYLEHALNAEFSHPLYALAKIESADQWQLYRYLFKMHLNLQMVRTYMALADKYDRRNVPFYSAPWKEQSLKNLDIAENYYQRARYFWDEALIWIEQMDNPDFRWIYIPEISNWHNERTLIRENKLDFAKILDRHLAKLQENREKLHAL